MYKGSVKIGHFCVLRVFTLETSKYLARAQSHARVFARILIEEISKICIISIFY